MRKYFVLLLIAVFLISCSSSNKDLKPGSKEWLNDLIKKSDTTYQKPYFRRDFVTAYYYENRKDSMVCQVMKDSAGVTRQLLVTQKGVRSFYAQYYANGQLQADLPLDTGGQFDGPVTNYYENGEVESKGAYTHGLKTGEWKSYDSTGKLIATDTFDEKGQVINH